MEELKAFASGDLELPIDDAASSNSSAYPDITSDESEYSSDAMTGW
jgi:hypothetical protein